MVNAHIAGKKYMVFGVDNMKRREFLKILGVSLLGIILFKPFAFAKRYTKKCLYAIKNGIYPGSIKNMDKNIISKKGRWLG
jgi:hypothetical protein